MLNRNYFSKEYQKFFDRLKLDSLEDYINIYENTQSHIKSNSENYQNEFKKANLLYQFNKNKNENLAGEEIVENDENNLIESKNDRSLATQRRQSEVWRAERQGSCVLQ